MTNNAVGLLLNYCLELPDPPPGRRRGLGFDAWNGLGIVRTGRRSRLLSMGFKEERLLHWTWVLPEGAEGNGDPMSAKTGRHAVMFSFCAGDWESGGREHVQQMIDRQ